MADPYHGVEYVAVAAVRIRGVTISLPRPARHAQVLHTAEYLCLPNDSGIREDVITAEQGFLTSTGRFVTRVEAKHIGFISKQPILRSLEKLHPTEAFSEDFW